MSKDFFGKLNRVTLVSQFKKKNALSSKEQASHDAQHSHPKLISLTIHAGLYILPSLKLNQQENQSWITLCVCVSMPAWSLQLFTNWKHLAHHEMKNSTKKTQDSRAARILYRKRRGQNSPPKGLACGYMLLPCIMCAYSYQMLESGGQHAMSWFRNFPSPLQPQSHTIALHPFDLALLVCWRERDRNGCGTSFMSLFIHTCNPPPKPWPWSDVHTWIGITH